MYRFYFIALIVLTLTPISNGFAEEKTLSFNIKIEHRKVVGQKTIRVKQGEQISLNWSTDEKVKVHLHGYDIEKTVAPGKPVEFRLRAKVTGRFPVTAHGFGQSQDHGKGALLYFEVHPK